LWDALWLRPRPPRSVAEAFREAREQLKSLRQDSDPEVSARAVRLVRLTEVISGGWTVR
jgi:hypothetical protein